MDRVPPSDIMLRHAARLDRGMPRARLISGLLLVVSCILAPACLQSSRATDSLPTLVRAGNDAIGGDGSVSGGYMNYMQADEPIERVRTAFGDEAFERLQALKRRYDPDNVLRRNQNIPPL